MMKRHPSGSADSQHQPLRIDTDFPIRLGELPEENVQKSEKIWMDGRLVNWDDAKVHVLTHTLHYGYGVFEGIRCYQTAAGRSAIFRLSEHNRRLFDSAKILGLKIPFSSEEIEKACI